MKNDNLERLQSLAKIANQDLPNRKEVATSLATVVKALREHVQPLFKRMDEAERGLKNIQLTPGPRGLRGPKGDKGDRGEPGRNGRDGKDGRDGRDGEDGSPDSPREIRDKLEKLTGDNRLHHSAIAGLEQELAKAQTTAPRTIFGVPSRGLFLYLNGVKYGIVSNLNLVPGSGVSLAYSKVNGQDTITINASGSGETVETPSGLVNGSNQQFTPSAEPKYVVSDGTTYFAGAGYTWDGTHINMSIAPSSFIRDII